MSDVNTTAIYELLYRLGITAAHRGFFPTAYAVYLACQQPERLMLVTKWLYPEVAQHYETGCGAVEQNIRAAAGKAWESSRPLLERLARTDLPQRPSAAQFLAILVAWLKPKDVA